MDGWATAPRRLSRRGFIAWAAAAMGLYGRRAWAGPTARRLPAGDPARLSPFEREHLPILSLPAATSNGGKVPMVVEMAHPMTPDHYVSSVGVVNERDPVASKGVFHLTPGNGRVYLAWQARLGEGPSQVSVTAECNRHGRWSSSRTIEVARGGGGCARDTAALERTPGEDIHGPVLRIAELVERGRIRRDEIIHAQVKMRHPSRTGLAVHDGQLVRESDPFYLKEMEVYYRGERVSRFALTPALSDDPFITLALRAGGDGPLVVRLVNSRGQLFEATHEIQLG